MKSPNYKLITFVLILLFVGSCFFAQKWHSEKTLYSLQCDSLKKQKDSLKIAFSKQLSEKDERILKLTNLLESCNEENTNKSINIQRYKNRIDTFDEECEHEKDAVINRYKIDNSSDDNLGQLLSRFGLVKNLQDAGRVFLSDVPSKELFKSNSGRRKSPEQSSNGAEKNKSP